MVLAFINRVAQQKQLTSVVCAAHKRIYNGSSLRYASTSIRIPGVSIVWLHDYSSISANSVVCTAQKGQPVNITGQQGGYYGDEQKMLRG